LRLDAESSKPRKNAKCFIGVPHPRFSKILHRLGEETTGEKVLQAERRSENGGQKNSTVLRCCGGHFAHIIVSDISPSMGDIAFLTIARQKKVSGSGGA
jgi:hypothetical protein